MSILKTTMQKSTLFREGISKICDPNGHVYYVKRDYPLIVYAPPLKEITEAERDQTASMVFDTLDKIPQKDQDSVSSVIVDSQGLRGGNLSSLDSLWQKQTQVFINLPDLKKGLEKLLRRVAKGVNARYRSSSLFRDKADFIQSYVDYFSGNTNGWPNEKKEIFSTGKYSAGNPVQGGLFYRVRSLVNLASHALFTDVLADLTVGHPWLSPVVNKIVQTLANLIMRG